MRNLKEKILYCLQKYPQTRDCDITLTFFIWYSFHRKDLEKINDEYYVKCKSLKFLPREDNVKRIRAKIQNEENKFLPESEKVREKRRISEIKWRKYLGYIYEPR